MIRGRKIALRPVEEADAPLIHRWMNHPEVWHYMDYELPFSLADVKDDIERSRRDGHPFTILVGDRPIGRIGLNAFRRRDRICSLYMFIGEPSFWGQGYAQDATLTLLRYAFERWDLRRIELWALGDNNRAVAMYERCGFDREAVLPERSFKEGRWVDRIVMSVTRESFANAARAWEERHRDRPESSAGFVTQDSQA